MRGERFEEEETNVQATRDSSSISPEHSSPEASKPSPPAALCRPATRFAAAEVVGFNEQVSEEDVGSSVDVLDSVTRAESGFFLYSSFNGFCLARRVSAAAWAGVVIVAGLSVEKGTVNLVYSDVGSKGTEDVLCASG